MNYINILEKAIEETKIPSFIIHQKTEKDFNKIEKLEKDCVDINKYVESILSSANKCKNNTFSFSTIIENINKLDDNKNYFEYDFKINNNELQMLLKEQAESLKFIPVIFNKLNENGYKHINILEEKTKLYTHNENSFLEKDGVIAKIMDGNISDKQKLIKLTNFINETLEKEIKAFSYYIEDSLFKEKFNNPDITIKHIENITKQLVEKYISLSGKSLGLEINNTILLSEIEKSYKEKNIKEKDVKEKTKQIKHIDFS